MFIQNRQSFHNMLEFQNRLRPALYLAYLKNGLPSPAVHTQLVVISVCQHTANLEAYQRPKRPRSLF